MRPVGQKVVQEEDPLIPSSHAFVLFDTEAIERRMGRRDALLVPLQGCILPIRPIFDSLHYIQKLSIRSVSHFLTTNKIYERTEFFNEKKKDHRSKGNSTGHDP